MESSILKVELDLEIGEEAVVRAIGKRRTGHEVAQLEDEIHPHTRTPRA